MNIEDFREYCLSLPKVTEDMPFGEDVLVFRLHNKIFACVNMVQHDMAAMKCDPEKAIELRERYPSIEGAFHWNKKFWNQVRFNKEVSDKMIKELVDHAYNEIWKSLPKKLREETDKINSD